MTTPIVPKSWLFCCLFALCAASACGDGNRHVEAPEAGGLGTTAGTSTSGGSDGASGTGEAIAGKANVGNGGAAGTTSSATSGTAGRGPIDAPPAPAVASDVPRPTASVSTPNLKVLPWAGFKAAVTYTFDDTQPSQTEHWQELKATGVPMTFFANPSANWQAGFDVAWTAVAASGSEIGNHTWSHCRANLSGCTSNLGTAEEEIDKASAYIVEHFGVPKVYSFASPFGDSAWNALANTRFLVGRGVMSGMVPPSGVSDWYNLPVFAVTAGHTAAQFNASIDSARTQGRWNVFLFHSILPTANNWYAGVDISAITENVTYAKSSGDVWIDTFTEIGAYVRGQHVLEASAATNGVWTWALPAHFPPGKVLRVTVDGGTLHQGGAELGWDPHGYYEVALDEGSLAWTP